MYPRIIFQVQLFEIVEFVFGQRWIGMYNGAGAAVQREDDCRQRRLAIAEKS